MYAGKVQPDVATAGELFDSIHADKPFTIPEGSTGRVRVVSRRRVDGYLGVASLVDHRLLDARRSATAPATKAPAATESPA